MFLIMDKGDIRSIYHLKPNWKNRRSVRMLVTSRTWSSIPFPPYFPPAFTVVLSSLLPTCSHSGALLLVLRFPLGVLHQNFYVFNILEKLKQEIKIWEKSSYQTTTDLIFVQTCLLDFRSLQRSGTPYQSPKKSRKIRRVFQIHRTGLCSILLVFPERTFKSFPSAISLILENQSLIFRPGWKCYTTCSNGFWVELLQRTLSLVRFCRVEVEFQPVFYVLG